MTQDLKALSAKLDRIEQLAKGSKWGRLMAGPMRYLSGMYYSKIYYRLRKHGVLRKANTFFGQAMQLLLPASMDIYLLGGKTHDSEIRLARFLLKNLQSGQIFADVGAHFGYFSLLAAQLVGNQGRVYSFEPSRGTFEVLQKNTARTKQIYLHHNAISNKVTRLTFHEFPVLYSEYNSLDISQFEGEAWFQKLKPQANEIEATTLDLFFHNMEVWPDLIKIDVEGAEDQVLEGMQRILHHGKALIIMEYLATGRNNSPHRKAVDIAEKVGWQTYLIDAKGSLSPCQDIDAHLQKTGLDSDNIIFKKKG